MWRYTQVGRRGAPAKGVGRELPAREFKSLYLRQREVLIGSPIFLCPNPIFLLRQSLAGHISLELFLFDINVSFLTASILVYFSRSAGSNCSCNFFVLKFCDCVYSRHLFCNGQTRRRRRRTLLTNTLTSMRGIPLLGDFPARLGLTKRLRNGRLYCLH